MTDARIGERARRVEHAGLRVPDLRRGKGDAPGALSADDDDAAVRPDRGRVERARLRERAGRREGGDRWIPGLHCGKGAVVVLATDDQDAASEQVRGGMRRACLGERACRTERAGRGWRFLGGERAPRDQRERQNHRGHHRTSHLPVPPADAPILRAQVRDQETAGTNRGRVCCQRGMVVQFKSRMVGRLSKAGFPRPAARHSRVRGEHLGPVGWQEPRICPGAPLPQPRRRDEPGPSIGQGDSTDRIAPDAHERRRRLRP